MRPIFMLVIVLCYIKSLQASTLDELFEKNPNFRGTFEVSCQPVDIHFKSAYYPLIFSDSTRQFNLIENYLIFKLSFNKPGRYYISALSDEQFVSLYILSKDSLYGGKENPKRISLVNIDAELDTNKAYYLIATKKEKDINLNLSFCNYNVRSLKTIIPNNITKDKPVEHKLFSSNSIPYQGKRFDFFDISNLSNKNRWIRIKVDAKDFIPIIYGLNRFNEVSKRDNNSLDSKYAELYVNDSDSITCIAIGAYFSDSVQNKGAEFVYLVNHEAYPYNPNNYIEIINHYLTNPLLTFILGIIVSIFTGYIFYIKSKLKKELIYKLITDKIIIYEDQEEINSSPITIKEQQLYKCCMIEMMFINTGQSRIDSSYVKSPLEVKLRNIKRVVDVKLIEKGNGWNKIELKSEDTLKIDFNYIDVGDELIIKLIGEIDQEYYEKGGTDFVVSGKIAEVEVKTPTYRMLYLLRTIYLILCLASIIFLIITFTLDLVNVETPKWVKYTFYSIYTFFIPYFLFYIFYDRNTRKSLAQMFQLIPFYLKKTVK